MNNTLELELQQLDFTLTNVSTTVENLKGFQNILENHGMSDVMVDLMGDQLDRHIPDGITFKDASLQQAQEGLGSAIKKGASKIWDILKKIVKKIVDFFRKFTLSGKAKTDTLKVKIEKAKKKKKEDK